MKCHDTIPKGRRDMARTRFQTKRGNSKFELAKVTFLVHNTTSPYDVLDGPEKDFRLKGDNSKNRVSMSDLSCL